MRLLRDFAELQATNKRPMKMVDWIDKLDQFLQISEKKILTNAGSISTETAAQKASMVAGGVKGWTNASWFSACNTGPPLFD
jgi:hypothetical protein